MRRIPETSLWLGHIGDARDVRGLLAEGIEAVVELAYDEPPMTFPRAMIACRFPLVDGSGNPPWLLRAAVETVASLLRAGVPTLVCCAAGMSRTPSIAGAAIAMARGWPSEEGLSLAIGSGTADVSPALWSEVVAALRD